MTKEQIEAVVSGWLASELDYAEDCRVTAGPMSDSRRERQLEGLDIMAELTHEALLGNDYRKIEAEADALIQAAGFPSMDKESAEYGRLCRRLLRARLEYTRIETDRWNGVYEESPSVAHAVRTTAATPKPAVSDSKPSKTFVEVVALYFKECAKAKRTDLQMQAEFEKFLKPLSKDISIRAITRTIADSTRKTYCMNGVCHRLPA
jgi:hypothetical protein